MLKRITNRSKMKTRKAKRTGLPTIGKKVCVVSESSAIKKRAISIIKVLAEKRAATKRIEVMVKGLNNMYAYDIRESVTAVDGIKKYTADELNRKYAGIVIVSR